MKRGLVLGGGGAVGVAWEVGLIGGLLEAGVDLRTADVIVGTSAGSIVGTRLAAGQDVRRKAPRDSVTVPAPVDGFDTDTLREVFKTWGKADAVTPEFLATIGRLAQSARTVDESAWVAAAGTNSMVDDWPKTRLKLISVNAESGALGVHDQGSGVPLHRAIAASCAVPGMFPTITIDGAAHMDGGVRSGTSADAVLEDSLDLVLIIAPIVDGVTVFGKLAEACIHDEAAMLKAAGVDVIKVLPLPPEKAAFGDNLMDASHAPAAGAAGFARGRQIAGVLKAKWGA